MHRTDPETRAVLEARAAAGRVHVDAIHAAVKTGDVALIDAAIDALERRFPGDADIREGCRVMRAEVQRAAMAEWRAVA